LFVCTVSLACDNGGVTHDSQSRTMAPVVELGFAPCALERNDQLSPVEHDHTR